MSCNKTVGLILIPFKFLWIRKIKSYPDSLLNKLNFLNSKCIKLGSRLPVMPLFASVACHAWTACPLLLVRAVHLIMATINSEVLMTKIQFTVFYRKMGSKT